MAWFGAITSSFTQKLFTEINPNKVLEVKQDKYTHHDILCREDGLILYCLKNEKTGDKYDIVINRPCNESLSQAYSVFRSGSYDDTVRHFTVLRDKLPNLVAISNSLCSVGELQKICDLLRSHPSWTIAHLVAQIPLQEFLQHPQIVPHLNDADSQTGLTPLHVAVKTGNLGTVKQLLASPIVSIEHLDNEANSVFHYAAETKQDIILALAAHQPCECLNYRNAFGHTPLHIACRENKPDCVKALLVSGADVNVAAAHSTTAAVDMASTQPGQVSDFVQDYPHKLNVQEMKNGGTPLHWSGSREVIETLVDKNCNINALNFNGHTALHIMVMKESLECVVALLSRHADPNISDEEGNSALHEAVKRNNIPIVQALIVFGADLSLLNGEGCTARHLAAREAGEKSDRVLYYLHAVGAARCLKQSLDCKDGCASDGVSNGIPPPLPQGAQVRAVSSILETIPTSGDGASTRSGGRVLCLDGGGIRGLVLVVLLLHIERSIGLPIIHCFDWVAGTSTGAILALALGAGKTLIECLCLYFRMKEYAFAGNRPYSSEPLEAMLKEALGTTTVMAEISHPKIMIPALVADRKPVDVHFFRNYPSASDLLDPYPQPGPFEAPPSSPEQLLWSAARASGAAPSFFRSFGCYLDGGLVANNPTQDMLTEIYEYNAALRATGRASEAKEPTVVVSVGTGSIPVIKLKNNIDVFRPESLWDTARFAIGISELGKLLVDQATLADGRVVDRCRAWCASIRVPYFRFSPQLSEDIVMDEKNDERLVNMLWEAQAHITANHAQVVRLVQLLNTDMRHGR